MGDAGDVYRFLKLWGMVWGYAGYADAGDAFSILRLRGVVWGDAEGMEGMRVMGMWGRVSPSQAPARCMGWDVGMHVPS